MLHERCFRISNLSIFGRSRANKDGTRSDMRGHLKRICHESAQNLNKAALPLPEGNAIATGCERLTHRSPLVLPLVILTRCLEIPKQTTYRLRLLREESPPWEQGSEQDLVKNCYG
jgi:hypothetical protein